MNKAKRMAKMKHRLRAKKLESKRKLATEQAVAGKEGMDK